MGTRTKTFSDFVFELKQTPEYQQADEFERQEFDGKIRTMYGKLAEKDGDFAVTPQGVDPDSGSRRIDAPKPTVAPFKPTYEKPVAQKAYEAVTGQAPVGQTLMELPGDMLGGAIDTLKEVGKGVARFPTALAGQAIETAGTVVKPFVSDATTKDMFDTADAVRKQGQEAYPPTQAFDPDSYSKLLSPGYVLGRAVDQAGPSMMMTAIPGAGAMKAGQALGLSDAALKALALASAWSGSSVQEAGGMLNEEYQRSGKVAPTSEVIAPALVAGGLDALTGETDLIKAMAKVKPNQVVGRALAKEISEKAGKELADGLLKTGVKSGASEGLQEIAQTGIEMGFANQQQNPKMGVVDAYTEPYLNPKKRMEMAEAGAMGFVSGAPMTVAERQQNRVIRDFYKDLDPVSLQKELADIQASIVKMQTATEKDPVALDALLEKQRSTSAQLAEAVRREQADAEQPATDEGVIPMPKPGEPPKPPAVPPASPVPPAAPKKPAPPAPKSVIPQPEPIAPTEMTDQIEEEIPFPPEEPEVAAEPGAPVMQNRQRNTVASNQQMEAIASKPNYGMVSISRSGESGAPMASVVGNARELPETDLGAKDEVTFADGTRVPFRYAVVEADELEASHDVAGKQNPAYQQAQPGTIRALNNGRTAGLKEAYSRGTAGEYQASLLNDTAHGVNPEVIQSKKKPVLIRLYDDQANQGNIGQLSNQGYGLQQNALEIATQDAEAMRPILGKLQFSDTGDINTTGNMPFFQEFMGKVATKNDWQKLAMPDGSALTQDGINRVKNAIFAAAYPDKDLIGKLAMSPDNDVQTVLNGLLRAAPDTAKLNTEIANGQLFDVGLAEPIKLAVAKLESLRRGGETIEGYLGQGRLEKDQLDDASRMLLGFFSKKRSARDIGDLITAYNSIVRAVGNPKQETMFGPNEAPAKEKIIGDVVKRDFPEVEGVVQKARQGPAVMFSKRYAGKALNVALKHQGRGSGEILSFAAEMFRGGMEYTKFVAAAIKRFGKNLYFRAVDAWNDLKNLAKEIWAGPQKEPGFESQDRYDARTMAEDSGMNERQISRAKKAGMFGRDNVTGFQEGRTGESRMQTGARLVDHVKKTGAKASYLHMDLKNLGGLNHELTESGANQVFRQIAQFVEQELGSLGASVQLYRHGGDEMSAWIAGADEESVIGMMERAQKRTYEYAKNERTPKGVPLSEIPHPKHENDLRFNGTGITFSVVPVTKVSDPAKTIKQAEQILEAEKENVIRRSSEASGSPPSEEQARRAEKGARGADSEVPGRGEDSPLFARGTAKDTLTGNLFDLPEQQAAELPAPAPTPEPQPAPKPAMSYEQFLAAVADKFGVKKPEIPKVITHSVINRNGAFMVKRSDGTMVEGFATTNEATAKSKAALLDAASALKAMEPKSEPKAEAKVEAEIAPRETVKQAETVAEVKPVDDDQALEDEIANAEADQSAEPEPVAAPSSLTQTGIQDFGEKIGGSRKDRAAVAKALDRNLSDKEMSAKSLSEIWPKKEIEEIEDTLEAALAVVLRDTIPAKPKLSYKIPRWLDKVKLAMNAFADLRGKEQGETLESLRQGRNQNVAAKVEVLLNVPRSEWGRIGEVHEYPDAMRSGSEGYRKAPFVTIEIDGKSNSLYDTANIEAALPKIRELIAASPAQAKMQFEVRRGGGEIFINKKGDALRRRLKTFATAGEAFEFIKTNYDALTLAWEDVKDRDNVKEKDVRGDANRPRVGSDHRQGKDATPEMFETAFGFRGVEFGNWVSQGANKSERQGMMNHAYDALLDLAKILNVPSRALSLDGTLGLAFGARGSGWGSAHYEPGRMVINLTKTRGAGTFAHEFFHALDHYFHRQRQDSRTGGREETYITYAPEQYYREQSTGHRLPVKRFEELSAMGRIRNPENWKLIDGVRPEVSQAFSNLVKALDASPMSKRSSLIDKGSKGYWSRIIGRAARAFENYVIFKMQQEGYHNDYLANVVAVEDFGRDLGRYPYLMDGEIAPVAKAFDDLFATIKTRETDRGVALYNRENKNQGDQDALLEKTGAVDSTPRSERGSEDDARRTTGSMAEAAGRGPGEYRGMSAAADGRREGVGSQNEGGTAGAGVRGAENLSPQEKLDTLTRLIAAEENDPAIDGAFVVAKDDELPPGLIIARSLMSETAGKSVVFFHDRRSAAARKTVLNGVVIPGRYPDTIFVNVGSDKIHLAVTGHELFHLMKRDAPDLFTEFRAAIADEIQNFGAWKKRFDTLEGKETDIDLAEEELFADFLGDQMMKQSFWDRLANKKPSVIQQIIDIVSKFLRLIQDRLRGEQFGASQYFRDLQKVQNAMAETMKRYADRRNQGKNESVSGNEVLFSRPDPATKVVNEAQTEGRGPDEPRTAKEILANINSPAIKEVIRSVLTETASEKSLRSKIVQSVIAANPAEARSPEEWEKWRKKLNAQLEQAVADDQLEKHINRKTADWSRAGSAYSWLADLGDLIEKTVGISPALKTWMKTKIRRMLQPFLLHEPLQRLNARIAERVYWNGKEMAATPGIRRLNKQGTAWEYEQDNIPGDVALAAFKALPQYFQDLLTERAKTNEAFRQNFVNYLVPAKKLEVTAALIQDQVALGQPIDRGDFETWEATLATLRDMAPEDLAKTGMTDERLTEIEFAISQAEQNAIVPPSPNPEEARKLEGRIKQNRRTLRFLRSDQGHYGYLHHTGFRGENRPQITKALGETGTVRHPWFEEIAAAHKKRGTGEGYLENLVVADTVQRQGESRAETNNQWMTNIENEYGIPEEDPDLGEKITTQEQLDAISGEPGYYSIKHKVVANFGKHKGRNIFIPHEVYNRYRALTEPEGEEYSLKSLGGLINYLTDNWLDLMSHAMLWHPTKLARDLMAGPFHLVEFVRDWATRHPDDIRDLPGAVWEGLMASVSPDEWNRLASSTMGEYSESIQYLNEEDPDRPRHHITRILDAAGRAFGGNFPVGTLLAQMAKEVNLAGAGDLPLKRIFTVIGERFAKKRGLSGAEAERFVRKLVSDYAFETSDLPEALKYLRGLDPGRGSKMLGGVARNVIPFMGYTSTLFKRLMVDPVVRGYDAYSDGDKMGATAEITRPIFWGALVYALMQGLVPGFDDEDEEIAGTLESKPGVSPEVRTAARLKLSPRLAGFFSALGGKPDVDSEYYLSLKGFAHPSMMKAVIDWAGGRATIGDLRSEILTVHPVAKVLFSMLGMDDPYSKGVPMEAQMGQLLATFVAPQMIRFGPDIAKWTRMAVMDGTIPDRAKNGFLSAFAAQLGAPIGKADLDKGGQKRSYNVLAEAVKALGANVKEIPYDSSRAEVEREGTALVNLEDKLQKLERFVAGKARGYAKPGDEQALLRKLNLDTHDTAEEAEKAMRELVVNRRKERLIQAVKNLGKVGHPPKFKGEAIKFLYNK